MQKNARFGTDWHHRWHSVPPPAPQDGCMLRTQNCLGFSLSLWEKHIKNPAFSEKQSCGIGVNTLAENISCLLGFHMSLAWFCEISSINYVCFHLLSGLIFPTQPFTLQQHSNKEVVPLH